MITQRVQTELLPCGRPKSVAPLAPCAQQLDVWQNQLRNYLISQSLKFTKQRWKIAELILLSGEHLDAQGLVEQVKKKHIGIGAATVYRTIKVLCDAQILKESLTDANGRVVYELFEDEHHDHIICLDCTEIFEFQDEKIESQQSIVAHSMNFKEVRHRHVIYAHCSYKSQL